MQNLLHEINEVNIEDCQLVLKFKGIVSRKFAVLALVSLESKKYSTLFSLKPFLNLSPFSYEFWI
jgi:hypothetical protein